MILDSPVDRLRFMNLLNKLTSYYIFDIHFFDEFTYSSDCTFFRFIYLTAKALRRTTMCGFLVSVTEPEKRTLERVQLRYPE